MAWEISYCRIKYLQWKNYFRNLFKASRKFANPFQPGRNFTNKNFKAKNLNNLNFKLLSHNNAIHIKIYEAIYITDEVTGQESFSVQAEEMVECYCNGKFAGVSFWNPHDFCIGKYLKKGENQIKLIVTGSAANNYTNDLIAYGLMQ